MAGVDTKFIGNADDLYFQNLAIHGAGLDALERLVAREVSPAATVLDIGANIGVSTILLARHAAKVIAYEPSPINVRLLRRNLELNSVRNVDVIAAAVSAQQTVLLFHEAEYGAGSHVVTSAHIARERIPIIEIPGVPLDSQALPPIAFIKMDVEGHEPNVLAGAQGLLTRDRPLVYSEFNIWCLSAFAGHSAGAFVRTLWDRFEVYEISSNGQLAPLYDAYLFLHDTIVQHRGIADIVFRPRSNVAMPTLEELAWPEDAVAALRK
ncbi:MAG: hypothetical protein NVSMB58_37480 [Terriglobales bacterium]